MVSSVASGWRRQAVFGAKPSRAAMAPVVLARVREVLKAAGVKDTAVARVNGACMAGGMGLMSMCDMAVAASHAVFGLPEVKVGVFPAQVLSVLQHLIPRRTLMEMCITGEPINAAQALEIGLPLPPHADRAIGDRTERAGLGRGPEELVRGIGHRTEQAFIGIVDEEDRAGGHEGSCCRCQTEAAAAS